MTTKQRIISFLQSHPEGVDDDELAKALGLSYRQQANMRCRELENDGLVIRRQINGKIRNFLAGKSGEPLSSVTSIPQESQDNLSKYENWFWEGNVQSKVINHLAAQGYQIRSVADTSSHQQGIDIVAEKNGRPIWVSVKGYPQGTDRTNPSVQAGHWFKQAIFDIIAYRERDKNVLLAVAFPDYPRYHSLANKITWLKPVANFIYFWVRQSGEVVVD
jgi:biotin operon repressor